MDRAPSISKPVAFYVAGTSVSLPGTPHTPSASHHRFASACHTCISSRVRCSGQKPICRQCEDGQRACTWSQAEPRSTPPMIRKIQLMLDATDTAAPSVAGRSISPLEHPSKRIKRASPDYTYSQAPAASYTNNHTERRRSDGPSLPPVSSSHPIFTRKVSPKSRRAEPLSPTKARSKTTSLSSTASTSMLIVPDGSFSPKNVAGRLLSSTEMLPTIQRPERLTSREHLQLEPISQNGSALVRPDLSSERYSSQLLFSSATDLHTYCNERRTSMTSTTLGLLRKTYLARFTTGYFDMAFLGQQGVGGAFTSTIIPLLDDLDGEMGPLMQDPMRLQEPLECCIFQEAYVRSLSRPVRGGDSCMQMLRRWVTALFLLSMSLERGLLRHAQHHANMAVSCFKLLDVKARYTGDLRKPYDACLLFLSEATFRFTANSAVLFGERSPIESSSLPAPMHAFDQLMRQTVVQRIQAFDILRQLAVATNPTKRGVVAQRLEETLSELLACDRQVDARNMRRTPPSTQHTFGSVAYDSSGWTAAAMQVVSVKRMVASIVDGFESDALSGLYFAMLDALIYGQTTQAQVKLTLDTTGILLLGGMLQEVSQRRWLSTALAEAGHCELGAALPFSDVECILQRVWQLHDAKGPLEALPNSPFTKTFMRDVTIIRDVQIVYGEVVRERLGLIAS